MRFTEYLIEAQPVQQPAQPVAQPAAGQPPVRQKPRIRPIPNTNKFAREQDPGQQPPSAKQDPWEAIKQAATDPNTGRDFMTLIGSMYQAKRRNPTVQMTLPAMVSSLPDGDEKEKAFKWQMAQLFNLAKNDDLPRLAARSQELQKSRLGAASKPGAAPSPGQMPPGQAKPGGKVSTQDRQTMLQTLMKTIKDTAPKLTTRQIKAASKELNAVLNKKKPSTPDVPVPGQRPQMVSTG